MHASLFLTRTVQVASSVAPNSTYTASTCLFLDALLHYAATNVTADGFYGTLLHYAATNVTADSFSGTELRLIDGVLGRPRNLLIFILDHKTLLWIALNSHGCTVFVDENEYWIASVESLYPGIEAYAVKFTTRVADWPRLIRFAKAQIQGDWRPVQNILFSNCALATNDIPNQLYYVDWDQWDVIIIDGPPSNSPSYLGRMAEFLCKENLVEIKVHLHIS